MVVWNRPGIGRPVRPMWNVPPSDGALLKFAALPPEIWLHGIQFSAIAGISSGLSGGSSMPPRAPICAVIWPWLCGTGFGVPVRA